ncbi:nicotinate phosphoribosyltransferase [Brevibacterium sp. 5221]|uniref:Nicotinate phosphoribosyltransferase n=1 Tax=Brevibacterium rongguiense TaxID=2695267 RepID=A0A6N9H9C9_9MICO|nr:MULTISPECIES: nicotinate phosphoribosyltransferase [Brevibacterium]MYM20623.1 nicotinate phosphoribosyltransferase [Brevibacterium rongguiense]WAL40255.1 nicotinate phosphoribosyltransferase [Brevibacterium sp. BRM-1]
MSDLTGPSSALLTDQYELTMLQAALHSKAAERMCLFEAFGRSLPAGRRYGVLAGTGRFLEALAAFRFGAEELGFLRERGIVDEDTLDWLADYRFTGTIRGYAEGEVYFPGSPLVTVQAPFAQAVVLETLLLSMLNHDSAIAAAASRIATAAGERPCADMGSRRTQEDAAVAAARAAYIAGFASTSNLAAGRRWGLHTIGTSAHAFTLLHDTEREAFAAQVAALGTGTTLLLDTYDVDRALTTAIEVAGPELGGVRIDSGDLGIQAAEVRARLDELGARNTKITVTSDLDEYAVAGLAAAPVDSYGVGTRLVTGSGAPTANLVYKLVAHVDDSGEWTAVQKASKGKASRGGFKEAVRTVDHGVATEEAIGIPALPADVSDGRPLTIDLVVDGEVDDALTGPPGVKRARARHDESMAELPRSAHRLQDGEPAIPTVYYRA